MDAPRPPATSGLVLGLNSALQRRVVLSNDLVIGAVNRAKVSSNGVGGKGQGAYLAATAALNAQILLAQFVGGDEGKALVRALKLRRSGADERLWISVSKPTRICTTIADRTDATEIVEPSSFVDATEVNRMIEAIRKMSPVDGLLCAGSLPPGIDGYSELVQAAEPRTVLFFDTLVFEDATNTNAKWTILKLNAREVLKAAEAHDPMAAESDSANPRSPPAVAAAAKSLCEKYGFDVVLWTDGPFDAGAYLFSEDRRVSFQKTFGQLPGPLASPIGAGDTVAGVTFARFLSSGATSAAALFDAFSFGLGCGAASCLTGENALFDADVAATLLYTQTTSKEQIEKA